MIMIKTNQKVQYRLFNIDITFEVINYIGGKWIIQVL